MSQSSAKIKKIVESLKKLSNPSKAHILQNYLKAPNDRFLGIPVPILRSAAKEVYKDLNLDEVKELISSSTHEIRMLGLIVLVYQFENARKSEYKHLMELIFDFYLDNLEYINNWDLVDVSCRTIVGNQLLVTQEYNLLYELANSSSLWARRIAIVSTYNLIQNQIFEPTFTIVKMLCADSEPLIHKAIGWLLREVGKQNIGLLNEFLEESKSKLAKISLNYALEKHPQTQRQEFLAR